MFNKGPAPGQGCWAGWFRFLWTGWVYPGCHERTCRGTHRGYSGKLRGWVSIVKTARNPVCCDSFKGYALTPARVFLVHRVSLGGLS